VTAAVAVLAIGLTGVCSAAPASATTSSAMTDAHTRPPSPLAVLISPLTVGVHIIEALAQDIANAVEYIATPAPIEIPAPRTST
jgi:F0F1-type ATP synthase membrane subunit c/vacuolar-type H+-ATPase subunit K